MSFERVLVANRGEIACRIIRSLAKEGLSSIAVYSDADREAPHVLLANTAVRIGPAAVGDSYLNIDALLQAASLSQAQAIHPGYGFLSENAEFAQRVQEAGLIWIGPPPAAITAMGDKAKAKAHLQESHVPMASGFMGDQSDDVLLAAAEDIGYPLLIKATAGGGGRGIRLVESTAEFLPALQSARSEAGNAFGDSTVMLEQFIAQARHVEVQIMADQHGHAVHFFERDCSAQRRRQKIIEEAPCPVLSETQRAEIGAAAVRAALSIGYEGAGTVEFLLADSGEFYFLEMNTRLQVEHPVTEMITGEDLVVWQLRVAMGDHLPPQSEIQFQGHAIEARIYAEAPHLNFLPQTGTIHLWNPASGPDRRIDDGIQSGQRISSHYDPMLAKLICWAPTRSRAIQKLKHCIQHSSLIGLQTNRAYLIELLSSDDFLHNNFDIGWVDTQKASPPSAQTLDWIAAAYLLSSPKDMWNSRGQSEWLSHLSQDEAHQLIRFKKAQGLTAHCGHQTFALQVLHHSSHELVLSIDGCAYRWYFAQDADELILEPQGSCQNLRFTIYNPVVAAAAAAQQAQLIAPMTGRVVAVHAELGAEVKQGDIILTLEAMKMEHPIRAGMDGIIESIRVSVGAQCSTKQILGTLKPLSEA